MFQFRGNWPVSPEFSRYLRRQGVSGNHEFGDWR